MMINWMMTKSEMITLQKIVASARVNYIKWRKSSVIFVRVRSYGLLSLLLEFLLCFCKTSQSFQFFTIKHFTKIITVIQTRTRITSVSTTTTTNNFENQFETTTKKKQYEEWTIWLSELVTRMPSNRLFSIQMLQNKWSSYLFAVAASIRSTFAVYPWNQFLSIVLFEKWTKDKTNKQTQKLINPYFCDR